MAGGGGRRRRQSSDQILFDPGNGGCAVKPPQCEEQVRAGQRGVSRGAAGEIAGLIAATPGTPSRIGVQPAASLSAQLSPGLLDLHALDTDLLPEIPGAYAMVDPFFCYHGHGKTLADSAQNSAADMFSDDNFFKSLQAKYKSDAVAKIKVVVRKRPLNKKESAKKEEDIIEIQSNSLTVHETKLKVDLTEYIEKHNFIFDAVLDEDVSNDEVYRETVEPFIPAIFENTKATCFAYGQTGSGKTYTMQPLPLRASQDILRLMHSTYRNQRFQLFISFFEIYGGKLFDLLNDRGKLCMREDGKQKVCIVGLQEYQVSDVEMIKELIEKGNSTRSIGITGANEESSRSHAILQLAIKRTSDSNDKKSARLVGKLSFIDLAGSERGADTTDNDKQTRIEGAEINKSLLALKECIRALDSDQGHIPFRGSKLTEVLRDSFIGNSRTVMISCISPSSGSCEHTLNTLRYADRVKSLSKGGNPRKDLASATLRESTASALSSLISSANIPELHCNGSENHDPLMSVKGDMLKEQGLRSSLNVGKSEFGAVMYQQVKWPSSNVLAKENSASILVQPPKKTTLTVDDQLDDVLKEEEDLVIAHRKQVQATLEILQEELNLLDEADQPGKMRHAYISRLNAIISHRINSISDLQSQLDHFRQRLHENDILPLSSRCR